MNIDKYNEFGDIPTSIPEHVLEEERLMLCVNDLLASGSLSEEDKEAIDTLIQKLFSERNELKLDCFHLTLQINILTEKLQDEKGVSIEEITKINMEKAVDYFTSVIDTSLKTQEKLKTEMGYKENQVEILLNKMETIKKQEKK